jgi:hypothetical protein
LHESSMKNHLEVCRVLIAAKADVNAKDKGYNLTHIRSFVVTNDESFWLGFKVLIFS